MPFRWVPKNEENFSEVVDEAIEALKKGGISGMEEEETNLLFICREFGEGRNRIQPCIRIGRSIENADELMESMERLALEYFNLPIFGLEGERFIFGVAEHTPGDCRYSRAIIGVIKRGKPQRAFFSWLWGGA